MNKRTNLILSGLLSVGIATSSSGQELKKITQDTIFNTKIATDVVLSVCRKNIKDFRFDGKKPFNNDSLYGKAFDIDRDSNFFDLQSNVLSGSTDRFSKSQNIINKANKNFSEIEEIFEKIKNKDCKKIEQDAIKLGIITKMESKFYYLSKRLNGLFNGVSLGSVSNISELKQLKIEIDEYLIELKEFIIEEESILR